MAIRNEVLKAACIQAAAAILVSRDAKKHPEAVINLAAELYEGWKELDHQKSGGGGGTNMW